MRYNVAQLLMEPTGSVRTYQLDESFEGPESTQDRAAGTVEIMRTHQGMLVKAAIETLVQTTCGRCLSGFQRASLLMVEEESFPTLEPGTGKKIVPPDESEGVIHIDERHMLDLSDVVRQYVLTDIPIKPLCSENCLGLCPECGSNLIKEKCKCGPGLGASGCEGLSELSAGGRD